MEEAQTKPSVAELAGKFKAPIPIPTGTEGSKPVRRRPPRSLQLPIRNQGEEEEEEEKPASPHPAKTKRNSSLIEKLQANLALSPSAILSSPKSPGLRLFPPSSPLLPCAPTPHVTPVTPTSPVTIAPRSRTQSEEEPPITFENPATPTEGSLLPSINKGRARHSIKRRPPSRRHRKSSEEEVEVATSEDTPLSAFDGPEAKAGEEEEKGDVFEEKEKKAKTEAVTPKRQRQRQRQAPSESPKAEAKKASEADSTATDSTKQNATTESPATETEPEDKPQSENTPGSQSEERQGVTEGGEEVTQPGMEGGEEEKVKERRKGSVEEKEKSTESSSETSKDQREPPTGTQTEPPTSTAARENEGGKGDELPCKEKEEEKDAGPKEENKSMETTKL